MLFNHFLVTVASATTLFSSVAAAASAQVNYQGYLVISRAIDYQTNKTASFLLDPIDSYPSLGVAVPIPSQRLSLQKALQIRFKASSTGLTKGINVTALIPNPFNLTQFVRKPLLARGYPAFGKDPVNSVDLVAQTAVDDRFLFESNVFTFNATSKEIGIVFNNKNNKKTVFTPYLEDYSLSFTSDFQATVKNGSPFRTFQKVNLKFGIGFEDLGSS